MGMEKGNILRVCGASIQRIAELPCPDLRSGDPPCSLGVFSLAPDGDTTGRCAPSIASMRLRRGLVLGCALTLAGGRSVDAQSTGVPKDSVQRDSVAIDSIRADSIPRVTDNYALPAAAIAIVAAPSLLLGILPKDSIRSAPALGYWNDRVSVYATEGLASGRRGPILGASWTGSGSVELFRRGLLVEGRVERFKLLQHVDYLTARAGRLWHPAPPLAGGITLGYRSVPHLRKHEGIEVGFPFIVGRRNAWLRFETSYVMSNRQSSWNYRAQGERRLGRTPFLVGCNAELKSWEIRRYSEASHGSFGIVLGIVFDDR